MNLTSLFSATAATLAAVLAAINLYVLGRRERHSWLRETLVNEYSAYLNASFNATHKAREYIENSPDADPETRAAFEREIRDVHSRQRDILTRLRLLAPVEAIYAAGQVHMAENAVIDLVSSSDGPPNNSQFEAARATAHARREDLIRAARKSMKVPGAVAKVEDGP
jgi:hypothetical protein